MFDTVVKIKCTVCYCELDDYSQLHKHLVSVHGMPIEDVQKEIKIAEHFTPEKYDAQSTPFDNDIIIFRPHHVSKRLCKHKRTQIVQGSKQLLCVDCKTEVEPLWWINNFLDGIAGNKRKMEEKLMYVRAAEDVLNKRQRTKCDHCHKMTTINVDVTFNQKQEKLHIVNNELAYAKVTPDKMPDIIFNRIEGTLDRWIKFYDRQNMDTTSKILGNLLDELKNEFRILNNIIEK